MMKSYIRIVIAALIYVNTCYTQNLVVNGNFDTLSSCPNNQGVLNLASPWTSARGTCDLYNSCDAGSYSTPNNISGSQMPHSGNGYAGFFAAQGMWVMETREYLHAQLRAPLIAGHSYCLTFYVNLSDSQSALGDYDTDMAVNDLGAYFSVTGYSPDPFNFAHLPVTPQIVNPSTNPLTDRNNWMQVSGSFIATGGESFITIGSFSDNANQDTTELDIWQSNKTSYYYIDDVMLMDCSINSPLIANINGSTIVCYGSQISLNASGTGGTPNYQFSWNGGAFTSNATFVTTATHDTIYTVEVKDSNGNISSTSSTITVLPLPNGYVIGDTTVCENSLVTVVASGGTNYQWHDGPFGGIQTTTPSLTTQVLADFDLVVGISDGTCVDNDTVSFHTIPSPNIGVSNDTTICSGGSATLEVNGNGTIMWVNGSTNTLIAVQPSFTTNYWVSLSSQGCVSYDTVKVTVIQTPIAYAGGDKNLCNGSSIVLQATGGTNFLWSNGLSASSITVSPTMNETYWVTVSNGNCKNTDTVLIKVRDLPSVTAIASDTLLCSGETSILSVVGNASAFSWQAIQNYNWSVNPNTNTVNVAPLVTTDFIINITDTFCTNSDTIRIRVIPKGVSPCIEINSDINVPNIFTPNGDGVNDLWEVQLYYISEFSLSIYNRWGDMVTELDMDNSTWDGRLSSGKSAVSGTYFYILRALGIDGKVYNQKGFLELVK